MIRAMLCCGVVAGTLLLASSLYAEGPIGMPLEGKWVGQMETSYDRVDEVLKRDGMSLPMRLMLVPYVRWQISKCQMSVEFKPNGDAAIEVTGSDSIHVEAEDPKWLASQNSQGQWEVAIAGKAKTHIWQADMADDGDTLLVSGDSWQATPFQVTRFRRQP
ncbi:hypothetical protein AB1L30_11340 [Bremerella sp. JC817]|uniref:hypothetical protein n=1 Tax=Bremerella sp. JC817 TaxID=3231756 RepID=UPI0034580108